MIYSHFRQAGITLTEIMVVIAILGILTAVTLPMYTDYQRRSLVTQAEAEIRLLTTLIAAYQSDHRTLPNSLDDIGTTSLMDPWGYRYRYLNLDAAHIPGKARKHSQIGQINTDYDLYSVGKDGDSRPPLNAKESRDDVIRANNGRYVGLASDY